MMTCLQQPRVWLSASKKTLGEVISALARKSLQNPAPSKGIRNGIPLLVVKDGTPVTMELVNQLRDELP
jgi:hypothetical protein